MRLRSGRLTPPEGFGLVRVKVEQGLVGDSVGGSGMIHGEVGDGEGSSRGLHAALGSASPAGRRTTRVPPSAVSSAGRASGSRGVGGYSTPTRVS
jgi:hypothetical protein